jgi:hypothetical protein
MGRDGAQRVLRLSIIELTGQYNLELKVLALPHQWTSGHTLPYIELRQVIKTRDFVKTGGLESTLL